MYTKTDWVEREGVNKNKFTVSQDTGTTFLLDNTPDEITAEGTPFSTDNMNKIEEGIYQAHEAVAAEAQSRIQSDIDTLNAAREHTDNEAERIDARIDGVETGKTDKVANATAGNLAGLDINGNLIDSELRESDIILQSEKGTPNGVAELDENGHLKLSQSIEIKQLLDFFYPMGTIFETTAFSTPAMVAEHMGGVWEIFAPDRVLIGANAGEELGLSGDDSQKTANNTAALATNNNTAALTTNNNTTALTSGIQSANHTHSLALADTGNSSYNSTTVSRVSASSTGNQSADHSHTIAAHSHNIAAHSHVIAAHDHTVDVRQAAHSVYRYRRIA